MTRDKSKFLTLNGNKFGNVTFDNDALGKIMGKGRVSLNNGKGKAHDVLFVVELKHKLLSVSQMCSRGYDVIFKARECEIESAKT